jgi:hypothetical protein
LQRGQTHVLDGLGVGAKDNVVTEALNRAPKKVAHRYVDFAELGSPRSTPPRYGRSSKEPSAHRQACEQGLRGRGRLAERASSSPIQGQKNGRRDRSPPSRQRSAQPAACSSRAPGQPAWRAPSSRRRGHSPRLTCHRPPPRSILPARWPRPRICETIRRPSIQSARSSITSSERPPDQSDMRHRHTNSRVSLTSA